jgi:hypothetical protein
MVDRNDAQADPATSYAYIDTAEVSTKQSPEINLLSAKLRSLNVGDRRHDSAVTLIALAPSGARLDSEAGLDGWDILAADGGLWRDAADVPYCTSFVDAAQDLCRQAAREHSDTLIAKALEAVLGQPHRFGQGDIAGLIARHILAELIEWKCRGPVG